MTAPGDLKRRLVLEAPNESDDGAGGVVRGYAAVTTLWAQVTPSSMRGETDADSLGASSRYRIVIRARADVTTRHRLVEGPRVYRILAARESADRRFLEIEAEVRGD
ncbi:head-tail adaptor protein [Microbacteriaceae bacterium K1510]|nr:head-tail adaptor protein [Microbacteriaceae bacterium K1510]